MRHRKSGRHLGRTWEHRKAMLLNLARSLVTYGRIQTTEQKAKELSPIADHLVSLALGNTLHDRRQAYKVLGNHKLVQKLFEEIGPVFNGVPGGFTRVVRLALPRPGDCASLAIIELTKVPASMVQTPKAKKKKEDKE